MGRERKPQWLRAKGAGRAARDAAAEVDRLVQDLSLHTVCQEAACPNLGECYSNRTATFLILGSQCTRGCTFCNVHRGQPDPLDPKEPERTALAVQRLRLRHAVITSVTRDDLPDGGAQVFAEVVQEIRTLCPNVGIEVLVPDFGGQVAALDAVIASKPDVINHNVETVPRLYETVRPGAEYNRSLRIISQASDAPLSVGSKSGIMVGLGEESEEVLAVLADLRSAGCKYVTIGQYLAPSSSHHPVVRYVSPEEFKQYGQEASAMGFAGVASAPLVRSSYQAEAQIQGRRREFDKNGC